MPWLKLWIDILDDPDLIELPESTCWAWALMLAAAKKHGQDGELPPIRKLSTLMRKPQAKVATWLDELVTAGMIESNGVTYRIHGWERWQAKKDATNAQRQARFKANHRGSPPAPPKRENKKRERVEVTRYPGVTEDGNGQVTALPEGASTPAPLLRCEQQATQRQGDEHLLFLKAIEILEAKPETQFLASQLVMEADHPEVVGYASWRIYTAALVARRPDKTKSWNALMSYARTATEAEYERYRADNRASAHVASLPMKTIEEMRAENKETRRLYAEYQERQREQGRSGTRKGQA